MAHKLDFSTLSGLEVIQGLLTGTLPMVPGMDETLNFEPIEVGQGMCTVEGIPELRHRNPHGTVHGGWYMAVLDTAASLAVFSALPPGLMSSTASIEIKLIKPIKPGRTYQARGQILNVGKRLANSRADLIDVETEELVAFATCTCAVFSQDGWLASQSKHQAFEEE